MRNYILIFVLGLLLATSARAQTFYVSTSGAPGNAGTIGSPWDYHTVCGGNTDGSTVTPPAAIVPGSTIFMRGGTYSLGDLPMRCTFNGTVNAPITIQNYNGERVIIDRPAIDGQNAVQTPLWLNGDYIRAIGLEVENSNPLRTGTQNGRSVSDGVTNNTTTVTSATMAFTANDVGTRITIAGVDTRIVSLQSATAVTVLTNPGTTATGVTLTLHYERPICVALTGVDTRFINGVVHDCGVAIFPAESQNGGQVYGNLLYNNGWLDGGAFGSTGYGMYSQNSVNTKLLSDNIIFNNFGYGIQIFSNNNGNILKGFDLIGNILFGAGAPTSAFRDTMIIGGYGDPNPVISAKAQAIRLDHNIIYNGGCCSLNLGFTSLTNVDTTVTNNQFAGTPIGLTGWQTVTWTGNTISFRADGLTPTFPATYSISNYTATSNAYTCLSSGSCLPSNWTSQGLDSSPGSTVTIGSPTGTVVTVRPNTYQVGRGNIAVFNWGNANSVTANLSSLGLANGQTYEIRDVQNFFGTPVTTGTYNSGSPTVSVPMTSTTVTAPIGYAAPAHTPQEFGAFVVLPTSTAQTGAQTTISGSVTMSGNIVSH